MRLVSLYVSLFQAVRRVANVLVLLSITASVQPLLAKTSWPTNGWQTTTLKASAIDESKFGNALQFVQQKLPNIRSLLIVRGGKLAFEKYYGDGRRDQLQPVFSVTKSVVSALTGIALAERKIGSLNLTVGDMFPDIAIANPKTRSITLANLLTMRAGLRWYERGESLWRFYFTKYRFRMALREPLVFPPGRVFNYSTAVSHLIGGAVSKAVGQSLKDYANTRLFNPMGITVKRWLRDPLGNEDAGAGLHLTPRQMAKFGYLYLKNGRWEGKQLVPAAWVAESTRSQIGASASLSYGYQFWIRDMGECAGYLAWGRAGQFIAVVPEKDLIVVVTSRPLTGLLSNHYLPLFDLVAAAVPGSCDTKKTLRHAVRKRGQSQTPLPTQEVVVSPGTDRAAVGEFQALFRSIERSVASKDVDAIMAHYADRYVLDGNDKASRVGFWKRLVSRTKLFRLRLLELKETARGMRYRGMIVMDSRAIAFEAWAVKEAGHWKFIGNQRSRLNRAEIPGEVYAFLASYSRAFAVGSPDRLAPHFSTRYQANGFQKADIVRHLAHRVGGQRIRIRIVLTRFERKGDIAQVDGFLLSRRFGRVPMKHLYGAVILENGQWRWYGNQRSE